MRLIEITGGGYTAVFNPDKGANCIRLRHDSGIRMLREQSDPREQPDNPYLYGMPILFPVNRIAGGTFTFEGRTYRFPINEPTTGCHLHGELHQTPFTVIEHTAHSLTCIYRATKAAPYLSFPHAFEIEMTYALDENGLHHTVRVSNRSDTNMPCLLGFHTTFYARLADGCPQNSAVRVGVTEEFERNMQNYLPTGVTPALDAVSLELQNGTFCPFSQPISRHYRGAGEMSITDTETGVRVVYENDAQYGFRLIYNGSADEYICLEPQNCLANCANAPIDRKTAGFDYIPPGQTKTYRSRIYLETGRRNAQQPLNSKNEIAAVPG